MAASLMPGCREQNLTQHFNSPFGLHTPLGTRKNLFAD